jgi:acylphosphatase
LSQHAIRLRVRGRVQGVGFRWWVRDRARRLGVAGWVRNLDDGDVELAAAGAVEAIGKLLSAVREGPPGARVDEVVELAAPDANGLHLPFEIER